MSVDDRHPRCGVSVGHEVDDRYLATEVSVDNKQEFNELQVSPDTRSLKGQNIFLLVFPFYLVCFILQVQNAVGTPRRTRVHRVATDKTKS